MISWEEMVEVAGIEPASFGDSMGLLRAQPAVDCRDQRCHRRHAVRIRRKVFPGSPSEGPIR